jgi:hypothetical protein
MRRRSLVLVAILLSGVPAFARIGTIDVTPACTLLFPYFEVDPNDPNGIDTVLAIQNTTERGILLNVTLWTEWGLPTDSFIVYLTGYDQERIDLYGVFNGSAPITASVGQDPNNAISPIGPVSQDINFASCSGILSADGQLVSRQLRDAHTGQPASDFFAGGNCGSRNVGDGIARGYVTADTVLTCQVTNPTDPAYYAYLSPFNQILGDYVILDRGSDRAYADTAVHIETSLTDPLVTTSGSPTFYGRFHGNTALDKLEPLPSNWAGAAMSGRTTIDYFRDPGAPVNPVPCGSTPAPFPLTQAVALPYASTGSPDAVPPANYFPWATGTTFIGPSGLPATAKLGWLFLDLDSGGGRQSWVTFRHLPEALPAMTPFGIAVPGIQLTPPSLP